MNIKTIAAAASTLIAGGAFAFPTMTYLGADDGRNIQISLDSGSTYKTVFAGELKLKLETSASSSQSLIGYCADPRTNMSGSGYGVTITNSSVIPGVGSLLGHIVNTYAPSLALNGLDDEAMALQVAIWEILVDSGGPYSVTGGSFRARKSDGNAFSAVTLGLINGILSDSGSGVANYYQSALNAAGAPKSQSILTPVPEPATMGVLAVGTLAMLRRRRAR